MIARLLVGALDLVGVRAYRHDIRNADGDLYMRRWILEHARGTLRLHNVVRSDTDRALHDHPWDFTSLILSGGYLEHVPATDDPAGPTKAKRYRAGDVIRRKAGDLHRLVIQAPAWTLVRTGPKVRSWGFATREGWIPWREFERRNGVGGNHD